MRRFISFLAAIALTAGGLIVTAFSSQALSPGVSFGSANMSTWQTNNVVYALAQAGGKVLAGGSFTQVRPPQTAGGSAQNRAGLVILDAETGAPASCQFNLGGTARVRSIATTADGRTAYIAGEFTSVTAGSTTVNRSRLAALNLDNCTVRSDFNAGAISAEVFGVKVFNNTLYIAGGFTTVRTETRQYFAALNATTGALLPWVADGQSYPDAPAPKRGRAVAISPDGTKVALGGYFYYINGTFTHSIAIVSAADPTTGEGGSLIRTYPQGFIPGNPNATSSTAEAPQGTSATHAIYSGTDGNFYIGNEGIGGGVFDGRAAFSWATGDQLWRDTCLGATQDLIEDNGTIYSANHAHDCAGAAGAQQDGRRVYLIAQNAATMEHYGWKPDLNDGTGEGIGPRALSIATATSGKRYLWVGGEFTSVNGTAQQGLTRFSDASAAPGTPSFEPVAMPDGSIQVRFRTVVDNDDQNLTYRVYRNNVMVWEGVATSFWWKRPQVTYVDTNVTAGTLYTYRVEVTDGTNTRQSGQIGRRALAPSAAYGTTVRSDNPAILHWDSTMTGTSTDTNSGAWVHDVGDTSADVAGRSGLAMKGIVTSTDSIPGDTTGSLVYDGVDDYVWTDAYEQGPTTYSVEAWIKTTTTRGGKIVGFGNGRPNTANNNTSLSGSYDRHVYMTNNGRIVFGAYTGSTVTLTSNQSYNDGNWHHIVATQGANGMRLYVDGIPVGSNSTTTAQAYMGVWHVGGDQLNGWPNRPTSNFFAGQIDEVAIYPTVLSRGRVVAHAQAGGINITTTPVPADAFGAAVRALEPDLYWRLDETASSTAADSSEFAQSPGSYSANVTRGVTGVVPGNAAIQTAGSNNSTVASATSSTPPTTDLSVGAWFRANPGSTGKIFGFENTQTGNGSDYDKMLYMVADGRLTYGTYVSGYRAITTPLSYNDGAWHYAMATHGSDGMRLYVDGQLVGTNSTTGTQSYAGYWRLGGGNLNTWPAAPTNYYFNGVIDEFTVFSKALTAEQINGLYQVLDVDGSVPTQPVGLTATPGTTGVALTWTASSDNVGVTGYRVYRGTAPNFVRDTNTLLTEVATPSYLDETAPTGQVYYVVVALDAAGNQSLPSAEVGAVGLDRQPPSVPTGLAVSVTDNDVSLTWAAATDDVGVTGYVVYRGTTADFVADAASQIAAPATTTLVDSDRTPGTWYYRVAALDAAGNTSPATEAVSGVVADVTAPSVPTNLLAATGPGGVGLAWTASSDDVAVTGYVVYRGTEAGFEASTSSQLAEIDATAASYTDLAAPGTWYYRVAARDAAGNLSAASMEASVTVTDATPPSVPTGLAASVSDDDVTLTWTASTDNLGVAGYRIYRGTTPGFVPEEGSLIDDVSGTTYTDTNRPIGTWYYRVVAVDGAGNTSAATAAVSAVIADTQAPSVPGDLAGSAQAAGAVLTWSASADNVGVAGYEVFRGATAGFTPAAGNRIAEPTGTTYTDNVAPGTWFYKVRALDAAGNASAATESVVVAIADTSAPSVPSGVTATVSGDDVSVAWSASSDNVGVTGYRVYRGTSPDFSVGAGSLMGSPTGLSFSDNNLADGTYYYVVRAVDAAGNLSGNSAVVSASVTPAPVEPVTVTATVVEDSSAVQASPTTNYGSNNQVFARGGTSPQQAFFKFEVPAAPAGTSLTSATLRLRTSNDSAAGSADSFAVDLVSGSWSEGTLTWNNRPTSLVANVGSIPGVATINTSFTVDLNVDQIGDQLGDTATLRLTGSAGDNLRLHSKEYGGTAYRPQLVLVFSVDPELAASSELVEPLEVAVTDEPTQPADEPTQPADEPTPAADPADDKGKPAKDEGSEPKKDNKGQAKREEAAKPEESGDGGSEGTGQSEPAPEPAPEAAVEPAPEATTGP